MTDAAPQSHRCTQPPVGRLGFSARRSVLAHALALLWLLTGTFSHLWAQGLTPADGRGAAPPQWQGEAQQWIDQQLGDARRPGQTLRPEVQVGLLDPRLRLAPCARVEPFLPQGARLWGRTRIGLRCADGATRWTVFLPVTVRAWGPAWVVRQPVAPGTALTQEDAELTEIDWAESYAPVLARAEDWVGAQAARALMPGQALRQGMVRPPQLFAAGAQVKLVLEGAGFSLAASGEALGAGQAGQPVRVRMANRRVVTGVARDAETVVLER